MKSPHMTRLLTAALVLLALAVPFGAQAGETQAQFNAQLVASQPFKTLKGELANTNAKLAAANAKIASLKAKVSLDEAQIAADGELITRMSAFGHAAGTPDALTMAIKRATARIAAGQPTEGLFAVSLVTEDTGFGPCTDMGEHVGDAPPGPVAGRVAYFKQCPINGHQYFYGAISGTGDIAGADKVWFATADCTGTAYQIDDGEMYNTMALTSGIVFRSPQDGALDMVEAGQTPNTSITLHSDYSGFCVTEDTVAPAYIMSANDINITGVGESVPANFIY